MSGCREVESLVVSSARCSVQRLPSFSLPTTGCRLQCTAGRRLRLPRDITVRYDLVMTHETDTRDILIRRATPADAPTLGRLGALLVKTHYDFDQRRFIAPTPQTAPGYGSFLASQLTEPNIVVLVAEVEGDVVGYTYAGIEGRDWMSLRGPAGALYDILVDPSIRRQGIGRKLLEATVAALKSLGAPQIVLSTADRNEAAQRLFERAGFRRTMIEMTRDV